MDIKKLTPATWPSYDETRAALFNGEIMLHYQPIVDLSTGELRGYEALARWGSISPPEICRIVEGHNLELAWIRQQLAAIDTILATEYPPTWISINITQRQLMLPDLIALLNSSPHSSGLHVEVLESVRLDERAAATLLKIKPRHILKADDIGSPEHAWIDRLVGEHAEIFHGLKLCRGLTQKILTDKRTAAACRHMLELAGELGLETVAEWVESEPQAKQLLAWGCTSGQGSLYGLPQPWAHWQEKHPRR